MMRVASVLAGVVVALLTAGEAVYEMPPEAMDAYLGRLQSEEPLFGARLASVAHRSLGTPYVNGPLGEGPDGKYDQDPLVDFGRVDCVTFVEQSLALAISSSCDEAVERLQGIRYKNGEISFETRNHFMISDWVANNRFCRDVSRDLGVSAAHVSRTISRRDYFPKVKAPELGQDTPDQVINLAYVPLSQVVDAEPNLPSPALIVFIGKIDWLFALHCGLYVRDEDGKGQLIHASSKAEAVVAVPLAEYLEGSERYLGFTAYALRDSAAPCPATAEKCRAVSAP